MNILKNPFMYNFLFVTINSPSVPWEWNVSYIWVFPGISM